MNKQVEDVLHAGAAHMVGDGFRVVNYFPKGNRISKKMSPFFLLDYHPSYYYAPTNKKIGVPPHPHRGFETVTLALEGYVAHNDSAGHSGTIGPGEVQWMTAASGILHKEYHEPAFAATGGNLHMLQLWVNLPRAVKMGPPKYQAITKQQIAVASLPGNMGTVYIIAGSYNGIAGPAQTFTPINMYRILLNKGGAVPLTLPQHHNTGILVTTGSLVVNGETKAAMGDFVLFGHEGTEINIEASENSGFIVLDGQPINEPVVQYGPFVMNTPEEINQAIADEKAGKFGILADD